MSEIALIFDHYSVVSRGLLLRHTKRDDGLGVRGSVLKGGTGLPSGKEVLPIRFGLDLASNVDGVGAVDIFDRGGPRHDHFSASPDSASPDRVRVAALVSISLQMDCARNDDAMVLLGVLALAGAGLLL